MADVLSNRMATMAVWYEVLVVGGSWLGCKARDCNHLDAIQLLGKGIMLYELHGHE